MGPWGLGLEWEVGMGLSDRDVSEGWALGLGMGLGGDQGWFGWVRRIERLGGRRWDMDSGMEMVEWIG